jgi:hypothetical protein
MTRLLFNVSKTLEMKGKIICQVCETSRFPYFLDNRLTDGGKVVSPTCLQPFTISDKCCVDPRAILGLEDIGQFKNPKTSPGIELTTFRLFA